MQKRLKRTTAKKPYERNIAVLFLASPERGATLLSDLFHYFGFKSGVKNPLMNRGRRLSATSARKRE